MRMLIPIQPIGNLETIIKWDPRTLGRITQTFFTHHSMLLGPLYAPFTATINGRNKILGFYCVRSIYLRVYQKSSQNKVVTPCVQPAFFAVIRKLLVS